MKMRMTRLGGRSPSRLLAVPYQWLHASGGQPAAPSRASGAARDLIDLLLTDHERIRRLLHWADDDARYDVGPGCPGARSGGRQVGSWPISAPATLAADHDASLCPNISTPGQMWSRLPGHRG